MAVHLQRDRLSRFPVRRCASKFVYKKLCFLGVYFFLNETHSVLPEIYTRNGECDLKLSISFFFYSSDNKGIKLPYTFVQYLFKGEEHEVRQIRPHEKAKKKTSYRRVL